MIFFFLHVIALKLLQCECPMHLFIRRSSEIGVSSTGKVVVSKRQLTVEFLKLLYFFLVGDLIKCSKEVLEFLQNMQ